MLRVKSPLVAVASIGKSSDRLEHPPNMPIKQNSADTITHLNFILFTTKPIVPTSPAMSRVSRCPPPPVKLNMTDFLGSKSPGYIRQHRRTSSCTHAHEEYIVYLRTGN